MDGKRKKMRVKPARLVLNLALRKPTLRLVVKIWEPQFLNTKIGLIFINAAIRKAKSNGIECAWSNEAFELWYLYHFHNRVTAMSRTEYKKSISDAVNRSEQYRERKPYQYEKNATDTLDILQKYGSQDNAIKWAEAQSLTFTDTKYAKHNPCTMVFKLVRQLIGKDEAFNKLVKEKIENNL